MGEERGESGRGAYWGWTWAQPRDQMRKVPKSQRPLPSCSRPGEKITVIDDSNEEWWRVRGSAGTRVEFRTETVRLILPTISSRGR